MRLLRSFEIFFFALSLVCMIIALHCGTIVPELETLDSLEMIEENDRYAFVYILLCLAFLALGMYVRSKNDDTERDLQNK